MRKQSFIHGAIILLAAGIINRLLGFIPRIALPRLIGAEGVGLYQMGYPLLITLITIITGGIPIAVAKLTAEAVAQNDERAVRNVLRASLLLVIAVSIPLFITCILLAPWVSSHLLTDDRVYYTFVAMSPILIFVSISAVLRGYFQGKSNMIPTAFSQVSETIVRSIFVLLFAVWMLPYGIHFAAAGAMAGVLLGEIIGMIVLIIQFRLSEVGESPSSTTAQQINGRKFSSTIRSLLNISIPITGSKLVGSTSYFLESIMIVQSLAVAGVATAVATAQYGMLQGMVIPIILLPGVLTYSLSVSLIPTLSEAYARKDMRTIHARLHQSIRLALVTGVPFVVFMIVLAEPICLYLYGDPAPAAMLKWMAPAALFLYFQSPLQATLQVLDKPGTALINTFIGAAIKLTLIVFLAAKLKLGIHGVIIAICCNIVLVTCLHWFSISRWIGFSFSHIHFLKAFGAMLITGFVCYAVMYTFPIDVPVLRFILSVGSGAASYMIAIIFSKLIDPEDFAKIPWIGPRIARWKFK